jgi:hypothetical protein
MKGLLRAHRGGNPISPVPEYCYYHLMAPNSLDAYVGRTVEVRRLAGQEVYAVPPELPDGTIVRVVDFDTGYFVVEIPAKRFKIFMGCVDHKTFMPPFGRTEPISEETPTV